MPPVAYLPELLAAPRALSPDPTWSIYDVARALGLFRHPHVVERRTLKAPATIVAHVTRLVLEAGFPAPLPTVRGTQLIDGVTRDSRWPARSLSSWFDDRLPPGTAAAAATEADEAARREATAAMDARAANLNLRVVNGGRS